MYFCRATKYYFCMQTIICLFISFAQLRIIYKYFFLKSLSKIIRPGKSVGGVTTLTNCMNVLEVINKRPQLYKENHDTIMLLCIAITTLGIVSIRQMSRFLPPNTQMEIIIVPHLRPFYFISCLMRIRGADIFLID